MLNFALRSYMKMNQLVHSLNGNTSVVGKSEAQERDSKKKLPFFRCRDKFQTSMVHTAGVLWEQWPFDILKVPQHVDKGE